MIKTSVRSVKQHSKAGAMVPTSNPSGTGRGNFGKHYSGTIRPAHVSAKIDPPSYGRQSGRAVIKTTGGHK